MQYSYEYDKVFEVGDHVAALGWPVDDEHLGSLAPAARQSLSGEGFSAPCIATVLYPYFLNPWAPWWRPRQECFTPTEPAPDSLGEAA